MIECFLVFCSIWCSEINGSIDIKWDRAIWIWLCLLVYTSAHSQHRISELVFQFFLIFSMKLDSHKVKSNKAQLFEKKSRWEGPKGVNKNCPKMRFFSFFTKIKSIHMYFFNFNMRVLMVFRLSAKPHVQEKNFFLLNHMCGKNLVLELWSKNL